MTQSVHSIRERFLEGHFGRPDLVVHPMMSTAPHVDVNIYKPSSVRPLFTLVTCGLSDHVMNTTRATSEEAYPRAELILYLKALDVSALQTKMPWEVDHLRDLADFPVSSDGWLEPFLSLPNGSPAEPYVSGSCLTHTVLLPPIFETDNLQKGVELSDGTRIMFLWVDFLSGREEGELRRRGPGALGQLLSKNRHQPPVDFGRRSYV